MLDFHTTEVRAREKMCENAKTSLLVLDVSKFGRPAPALGGRVSNMDTVIIDRKPTEGFELVMEQINDRLLVAEGAAI